MLNKYQRNHALVQTIRQLRTELAAATSTLNAIRQDQADSLLIDGQAYVLNGAGPIYRVITEEMQEGYAIVAANGIILFCNKNFAALVKKPLERVIGSSIHKLLKAQDRKAFASFPAARNGRFRTECRLKTGNHASVPVMLSANSIMIDRDIITCLVVSNLTAQKHNERFANMIFNQAKEPVIVCDRHGHIMQMNPAAITMFGKQLIGNDFNLSIPLSFCDGSRFRLKYALDSNSACGIEVTYERHDGHKLNLVMNAGRFNDGEDDSVIGSVVTLTDITYQRQLDREMARFDRFSLIGEMAAGIGHEVRNPLTTVRGYLQLFQQKPKYADHQEQLSTMIEELDRANSIITEFLSLAKNKRVELMPGNLNGTIHALFPLLQAEAFRLGHEIQTDIGDIPPICYDDKEIRQLILNLVRNGMEAMETSGIITIETFLDKNNVVLAIKDTGAGIPEKIKHRLGTPFFTTKEGGTGLGLSICYRIAEKHNAKIEVSSSSRGTTFLVKFNRQTV